MHRSLLVDQKSLHIQLLVTQYLRSHYLLTSKSWYAFTSTISSISLPALSFLQLSVMMPVKQNSYIMAHNWVESCDNVIQLDVSVLSIDIQTSDSSHSIFPDWKRLQRLLQIVCALIEIKEAERIIYMLLGIRVALGRCWSDGRSVELFGLLFITNTGGWS